MYYIHHFLCKDTNILFNNNTSLWFLFQKSLPKHIEAIILACDVCLVVEQQKKTAANLTINCRSKVLVP